MKFEVVSITHDFKYEDSKKMINWVVTLPSSRWRSNLSEFPTDSIFWPTIRKFRIVQLSSITWQLVSFIQNYRKTVFNYPKFPDSSSVLAMCKAPKAATGLSGGWACRKHREGRGWSDSGTWNVATDGAEGHGENTQIIKTFNTISNLLPLQNFNNISFF